MRWTGLACALVLTLVGVRSAWAAEVSVTTSTATNPDTGVTTVTVTVTVSGLDTLSNQRWKDLHLSPIHGRKFPKITSGTQTTVDDGPEGSPAQTWKVKRSNNGTRLDVYSDSQSGFSNGTYTFALDVADIARCGQHPVEWKATDDGNSDPATGVIDTSEGTQAPNFPQLQITAGGDVEAPVGQATALECSAPAFPGATYEVYTSRSLAPSYDDPLGLGINHPSDPVPSSWGLAFEHLSGTLNSSGVPPALPRVVVPSNPALVGQVCFVVFALKTGGGQVGYASAPTRVELVAGP